MSTLAEAATDLEAMMDGLPIEDELEDEGAFITEDELQGIVEREISDAQNWVESEISTKRKKLLDYYHGRPFGNEEEGRSQVVSRDVRDTIQAILPNLMRIFFGGENVVEFVPKGPNDDAAARQATDYVNHIIRNDNDGFKVFYEAFKDALLLKTGIVKYWWNDDLRVEAWEVTGITEQDIAVLATDPEVEIFEVSQYPSPEMPQIMLFDIRCERTINEGRVNIAAIPPEEFIISSRATGVDDALLTGHQRLATVSELTAMGYDYNMVLEHVGTDRLEYTLEKQARRVDDTVNFDHAAHESMQLVYYAETYLRVDYDGDGYAELRKICVMGDNKNIVANEEVPFHPFVDFCPDPEPHEWLGSGVGDAVDDVQLIKSSIMRNVLDSLQLATNPRMGVVEGQANMDDVLNPEIGAVIRMRQAGAVQPVETPFVGQHGFTALSYLDEVRENRTGMTKAAVGLDPDALQSSTRAAVAATITAAQERTELIARIFSEMGMRPLFRGILKLIVSHQDRARTIRLRNEWVDVDPRAWNADMDVYVNVGLGVGNLETKMTFLTAIAERQMAALSEMGPDNPIAGVGEYRNTLASMVELMGYRTAEKFFRDPATFQPPEREPAPDPALIIAQAEATKAQADAMNDANKIDLERQEMILEDDRVRDRDEAEMYLKAAEIEARWGAQVDVAMIKADIERNRYAQRPQSDAEDGRQG